MIFGYLILLIAVLISAIAAYYSVVGLTAIFAAAVVPVMIMGGALEAGKIVATVWLHNNWRRAGYAFKLYLVPAIIFLMLLTSMGIFGFLSKAHGDQSLVSGDAMAKVAIYDEKIKIAKDNIDANRKALKQMDEAVDQVMGRSSDEKGADKAVQIRRSQQKERVRLQSEIQAEQKTITALSEESAPLRAEFRKVEAEVGPIKYIAALIYGDEASQNMLEAAVRWVIILIVIVFDPLALCLILAANKQLEWVQDERNKKDQEFNDKYVELKTEEPKEFSLFQWSKPPEEIKDDEPPPEALVKLFQDGMERKEPDPVDHGNCPKCETPIINAPGIGLFCPNKECDVVDNIIGAREEIENKQLEEFFWRGRMIAKGLDADETARNAEQANALLAEVNTPEPDVDSVVEQAQQLEQFEKSIATLEQQKTVLEQERDALTDALNTLATEYERVNNRLPDVEQYRNQLQEELNAKNAELEVVNTAKSAAEHQSMTLTEQLESVSAEKAQVETQVQQMQQWVTQLEQDLREAIQIAHDKSVELETLKELTAEPVEEQTGPDLLDFIAQPDDPEGTDTRATFGTEFPRNQKKGDMFLRVDYLPPRLFKWNGTKWIEIDRAQTDRYAYDQAYIQMLVEKLQRGEYDPDDLNDTERAQVAAYLNNPAA